MEITTTKGLEGLVDHVQTQIVHAKKERAQLGLTNTDFNVDIGYYTRHGKVLAASESRLDISLLEWANEHSELFGKDTNNSVKDAIGLSTQLPIISWDVGEEESLYSNLDEAWIDNLRQILRELHKTLACSLISAFKHHQELPFRAYVDRIAFFDSTLYKNAKKIIDDAKCDGDSVSIPPLSPDSTIAKKRIRALKTLSKYIPLQLVRSMFFEYVEPRKWKRAMYGDIMIDVLGQIEESTIIFDELILPYAISLAGINRDTANYIYGRIRDADYGAKWNMSCVDTDAAEKVIRGIRQWRNTFEDNAIKAVDALAVAFKKDPSRMGRADREATTFEAYLNICDPKNRNV